MKRRLLISVQFLLVLCLGLDAAVATELYTLWERAYGGTANDRGTSVEQTSDGGHIIAGYTNSQGAGGSDVYLIKADRLGQVQWEKTFGGTANEWGWSVQQTSDGGYVIGGTTSSFGAGFNDVYLVKTDPNGETEWETTVGGGIIDEAYSVQQTADGGYIVAGHTSSYGAGYNDVYLVKTDPNGVVEWENTFGGSGVDYAFSGRQTSDGGYIVCGATLSNPADSYSDAYLIKTDSEGTLEWEKTFGAANHADEGRSVRQTSDGGYILTGGFYPKSGGSGDSWNVGLIKTDSAGNKVWEKEFGGNKKDVGRAVRQTSDGGYVIVGETLSYGLGAEDVYVIKTNSAGELKWEKTFGGTLRELVQSIQQTADGGYTIVGTTYSYGAGASDAYLVRLGDATPSANAGQDKIACVDAGGTAQVTLDGSGSINPADGELTYNWTWTVDGQTYDANTVSPTIELPLGQHAVDLIVSNSFKSSSPDQVVVTVEDGPAANAGEDQTVYGGIDGTAQVTLDGSGSIDPNGGELTYAWTWTIDDQVYDTNGVSPTIELPIGQHVIELIVSNGIQASLPDQVVVTVGVIPLADAGADRIARVGVDGIAQVALDGSGSTDPGGGELTYAWTWTIDGQVYDANGVSPTIELPVGEYVIELVVSNGVEDSAPDQVVISVLELIESDLVVWPRTIDRNIHVAKILAIVRLPKGIGKDQIKTDQPLLLYPGGIEPSWQTIVQWGRKDAPLTRITAYFDTDALIAAISGIGQVELQLVGQMTNNEYFQGSDIVMIKERKAGGGGADHGDDPDDINDDDRNHDPN
jgi:hypothetical protein